MQLFETSKMFSIIIWEVRTSIVCTWKFIHELWSLAVQNYEMHANTDTKERNFSC